MTAPKLTKPQEALLKRLDTFGGRIALDKLSPPSKRQATRMEGAGLLQKGFDGCYWITITQAGRDALEGLG